MKILKIVLLVLAVLLLLLGQMSAEKMIYVKVGAFVVFMYGMMRLSAKTPSKNKNKENNGID
ncbi:hypothetical protein [Flavobacterium sp. UMI-01]|uniref:hypothetical protein n=1 Tax=Flavobacterium sp. UMI-01 TaxID=1441053 RepID=UPI001C7D5E0C|nr:hypothetical protein [Flavobacterium sp. UMI-01]GIZ10458.1 hypothetical protein FUMI01_31820 [Flavobacterium sp. UMI-01]